MARLSRDVRGNTLAILAAALIPLAGMVGGAIDISRLYLTKTRLQHACDAGALAGRKQMGGGVWGSDDLASADQFFAANYLTGAYGSTNLTHSFTENAGKVTGTASAVLPMTLMQVLGKTTETLSVVCDAEMRLPNTDVMFVLDTTGSMDLDDGSGTKKINGLKVAVKCFYEIVARLDTDASCTTGTPSGGTGTQTQIRFGFMPYSTNVNVGKLLPTSYFADNWPYQSRVQNGMDWSDWINDRYTSKSSGNCVAAGSNTSSIQYRSTSTVYSGSYACIQSHRNWVPNWEYKPVSTPISGLKNGTLWNNNFQLPINDDGSNRTIDWEGCIEERATVKASSYDPIPSGAKDLNIDLIPVQSDASTLWGPALRELIYTRQRAATGGSDNDFNNAKITTTANYYNNVSFFCPTEAKKLQTWTSASTFDSYVDSLTPAGNTYHDIGMLWGARFMSPDGIFKTENALTPQGGEIQRNMIFMTDGDTNTTNTDYNAYGVPWFDRRQTPSGSPPSSTDTDNQVDARFAALCTAVKNKNITLWVISFGSVTSDTETRLRACATTSRYFSAGNSATLQSTFASIANQISQLRLTK